MCYQLGIISGSPKLAWHLADVVEEVIDSASKLNVSFSHVKRSANEMVDALAKEGVGRSDIVVEIVPE